MSEFAKGTPSARFLEIPLAKLGHPLKVPVKPSYVKFAKGTPSARFLKFCKVGTRGNYCKNKANKNTLAPMPSCSN